MKKTFQKELNTKVNHQNGCDVNYSIATDPHDSVNQTQNNSEDRRTPISFHGAPSSTMSPFSSSKGAALNHSSMSGSMEEELGKSVDLQYLKHVIFKFLTSKEYEVKELRLNRNIQFKQNS